jgi:hypothetical protein
VPRHIDQANFVELDQAATSTGPSGSSSALNTLEGRDEIFTPRGVSGSTDAAAPLIPFEPHQFDSSFRGAHEPRAAFPRGRVF